MRIKVIETGRYVFFAPKTKIRFREYSPIFSENSSFSFPFTIPVEENRKTFKFIDLIDLADEPETEFEVGIESDVLPFETGKLVIQPSTSQIQCNLIIDNGLFNNTVHEKKLTELVDIPVDMGDDDDDFIETANSMKTLNYPDADFQLPIMVNNAPYDNQVLYQFFKFINYYTWHEASPTYAKNNYLDPSLPDDPPDNFDGKINPYNITSFVPCPFVFRILQSIFESCGFKANGEAFNDIDINQLLFITNRSLDKSPDFDQDSVIKLGKSTDQGVSEPRIVFDIKSGGTYQDIYNRYCTTIDEDPAIASATWGAMNAQWGDGKDRIFQFHYKLIIHNSGESDVVFKIWCEGYPIITKSDELTIGAGETNTYEGNLLNYYKADEPYSIDNSYFGIRHVAIDPYQQPSIKTKAGCTLDIIPISDCLTIFPEIKFNLKNFLPDITVKQLLADLKWLFGIVHCVDGDTINLRFFTDIYNELPFEDLSEYALVGHEKSEIDKIKSLEFAGGFDSADIEYVSVISVFPYSTINNYVAYYIPLGQWWINKHDEYYNFSYEYWKKDMNKRAIGNTGTEIVLSADLPKMVKVNNDQNMSNHWIAAPAMTDKLVSPFNTDTKDMAYTLSFWRGMQNDSNAYPYPFTSPYVYKISGAVIANIQLRFNGDYGTWLKYLEPMVRVMNAISNLKTLRFDIPQHKVRNLRFDRTYLSHGLKFMIYMKDYEFDVNSDSIINSQEIQVISL